MRDTRPSESTADPDRQHAGSAVSDVSGDADRLDPVAYPEVVVTIDGPAGTGKSSVSKRVADRLGLWFLDTGAMYRAAAAIVIDRGLDPTDPGSFLDTIADARLHFDWSQDPPAVLAWDEPLGDRIRDKDVTSLVSPLAASSRLRELMVRKQRLIAQQHPRIVSEGRDQGSVVFPVATAKFYLDADPRVRAQRRVDQLIDMGREAPSLDEALEEILSRDDSDRNRRVGPLVCPDDAITIDTTGMRRKEVVSLLVWRVREAVNA